MRRQTIALVLAAAALAAVAGCNLQRKDYEAVSLGQSAEEVRKILGEPRYRFEGQWIYTRDDPRDLTKVEIHFDADDQVVGKSWQNPEKPWENHREGRVPGG
jgi:hypothetical protein